MKGKERVILLATMLTVAVTAAATISLYLAISSSYLHKAEPMQNSADSSSIDSSTSTAYPPISSNPHLNVFAVSERASTAIAIALQNNSIRDMVSRWLEYGAYVTVAGVQPVELSSNVKITAPHQNPVHHELVGLAIKPVLKPMLDNLREEVSSSNIYNSSRYGEVIIAVNWNAIDAHPYPISSAVDLAKDEGKVYEAHQQITRVVVDIDERRVKDVMVEQERFYEPWKRLTWYMETNVFMPTITIKSSTYYYHSITTLHTMLLVHTLLHMAPHIDSKDIDAGGVW
ncbi:MAG: hypothetical protein QXW14_05545 [Candidatus Nitrosocaldus sp.]